MIPQFLISNPFLLYCLAGLVGMVTHAAKKVSLKQTSSGLVDYFVHLPGRSVGAITTMLIAAAGVAASGQLTSMDPLMVVGTGFLTGFSADSAVNAGAPPAQPS